MKPILVVVFMLGLIAVGCVSPDQRAEELYRSGKYEAVLGRYPDSQWADSAKKEWLRLVQRAEEVRDSLLVEADVYAGIKEDAARYGCLWVWERAYQYEKTMRQAAESLEPYIAAVRKDQIRKDAHE